ncbi:MAG TPA: hypothetical protein VEW95_00425 [Candidatus Limnocylindrales bacterium]|nr:hypothetical protein [Candidatus Limnocylindrales bacterium]
MSDKEFVIEMEEDTEGHGARKGIVEPEDVDWLDDRLRRDGGRTSFRISLGDEDDTEGHGLRGGPVVRVTLADEDDTEGHAIAIHFPSRAEADAFRRRLLVTGVLVGTVALGAAGGVGLSALQSDAGSAGAPAAATQTGPMDVHEAPAFGINAAATQAGPMDVHEAPAFQPAAAPIDADRDIGIMDASGATAGTQTGPMDAHEAPAFQQADAAPVDTTRDIGIMDASGAAAGTQSDSTDVHQLRRQAPAQTGPMDAHEAPAFQSSTTEDEGADLNDVGGPTPR